METTAAFTARSIRDGKCFIAFSPEYPEGSGQGMTEAEAVDSLRESIILLMEDRREELEALCKAFPTAIEMPAPTTGEKGGRPSPTVRLKI